MSCKRLCLGALIPVFGGFGGAWLIDRWTSPAQLYQLPSSGNLSPSALVPINNGYASVNASFVIVFIKAASYISQVQDDILLIGKNKAHNH
ncbi:hypothetical protein ASL11_32290 [Paenibacillus sp. Soil750]|nr:hypothetical protein ASL11_32290 [Paenibacillus sp. Soil750]